VLSDELRYSIDQSQETRWDCLGTAPDGGREADVITVQPNTNNAVAVVGLEPTLGRAPLAFISPETDLEAGMGGLVRSFQTSHSTRRDHTIYIEFGEP